MTKPNQATIFRKRQVLTAKGLTKSLGEYGSQGGVVPLDDNAQQDTSFDLPWGTKTSSFGNAYFKGFNLYTTVEVQALVSSGKLTATDRFVFWNLDTNTLNAWNGSEIVSLAGGSNSMDYLFGDGSDGDVTMVADGSYDRMKNFENFTLNSGITLSKTTAGSPLFIRCTGTCTINGTINLSGKGFAGGANVNEAGKGYPADVQKYDYTLSGIGVTNLSSGGNMDLNAAELALASLNFDQIPFCGGGGGGATSGTRNGGAGTSGQGYKGGSGTGNGNTNLHGGGGGGAGGVGTAATTSKAGDGGTAIACSISGVEKWYGGGGGGGTSSTSGSYAGAGGKGGGNGGSCNSSSLVGTNGANGTDNTGGGGGGGGSGRASKTNGNGGNGGSGIVIVRYTMDMSEAKSAFENVTGGTKTRDGDFDIYTFTQSGTIEIEGCSFADVLIVGGGGGGGSWVYGGGGGGAGGVIYEQDLCITGGVYQVIVGAGGAGGTITSSVWSQNAATNGANSTAFDLVAIGGGAGGSANGVSGAAGAAGGSGGGGGGYTSGTRNGGAGTSGQGYKGGIGTGQSTSDVHGGGGGGAGAVGTAATTTKAGDGGTGIACSISGVEKWYGGGGGGGTGSGSDANKGAGGNGGGGAGGRLYASGTWHGTNGGSGTANTGGGGGGGGSGRGQYANGDGGNGGSGIVIIRCRHPKKGMLLFVR